MPTEPRRRAGEALRWVCLLIATVLVWQLFRLGAQPFAAGLIPAPWDKLAHLALFSALTVLLWTASAGRMPLAVIALVIAVGALDELVQAGHPGRVADALDLLADSCAGIGTAGIMLLRARGAARDS